MRLVIAAILGGLVGIERERLDRAAGLRTHTLVCLGSCLIMIASAFGFADVLGTKHVTLDPSRIAAQIVSGIGFLGAGTIIFRREVVRGLTTAASIWVVAGIGIAVGGGLYVAATATTVLVLIVLAGIKPIERRLFSMRRPYRVSLTVQRREVPLFSIEKAVEESGMALDRMLVQPSTEPDEDRVDLVLLRVNRDSLLALSERLRGLTGVRRVEMVSGGVPRRSS